MNVIAAIPVDLETTPLGTRSHLGSELLGRSVLRRTVERVTRAREVSATTVMCPHDQTERCRALLEGTCADVQPFEAVKAPWTSLVRAARKWALDGWRGGIGGTTWFDEYVDCRVLAGLLENKEADALLAVPPAAAAFDPALADRMIGHRRALAEQTRMVFCQAPPGIAGLVLDADLIREVGRQNVPIGWIFTYKPDNPLKDLIFQPACFDLPAEVRHAAGRLIVDTERAMRAVSALLRDHPDPDALATGRWLQRRERDTIEPLPREVEIELTTDDPYPDAVLRPRGDRVGRRGPIEVEAVRKIAGELSRFDDSLVVLGGFGEPLRHPQFEAVLDALRPGGADEDERGVYGLCVRTAGVDLDELKIASIIAHQVDVLNVVLDAWTPELYGQVQSPGDPARAQLEDVLARIERVSALRQERHTVRPIVVPELTKARENLHELDAFHDGWLRRVGAVCISGYSHRAGQIEDRSVMNMAPPGRSACRRLRSRCVVLADGRVTVCDQDFRGLHTVGDLNEQSLEAIWAGDDFERLRRAHRTNSLCSVTLCPSCDEWHRP
jgi:hypothetical protein